MLPLKGRLVLFFTIGSARLFTVVPPIGTVYSYFLIILSDPHYCIRMISHCRSLWRAVCLRFFFIFYYRIRMIIYCCSLKRYCFSLFFILLICSPIRTIGPVCSLTVVLFFAYICLCQIYVCIFVRDDERAAEMYKNILKRINNLNVKNYLSKVRLSKFKPEPEFSNTYF